MELEEECEILRRRVKSWESKMKSWEIRRGMFSFLLFIFYFLHFMFMIISLPSSFPFILFGFRFIFGWCGCISLMNCWFLMIDDCWGWMLINASDLWIFFVFFFILKPIWLLYSFLSLIFHKYLIFLSSKFILCFLVRKKEKEKRTFLLKNMQSCFIQYANLKKKKFLIFRFSWIKIYGSK